MPEITIDDITIEIPQDFIQEYSANTRIKQKRMKGEYNKKFNSAYLEKNPQPQYAISNKPTPEEKRQEDSWNKDKRKSMTDFTKKFNELVDKPKDAETTRRINDEEFVIQLFDNRRLANSLYDKNNRIISANKFTNSKLREGFKIVQEDRKRLSNAKKFIERVLLEAGDFPQRIQDNSNMVLEEINDILGQAGQMYQKKKKQFSFSKTLGVVDVADKNERQKIYDYWAGVADKEQPEFLESLGKLALGLSKIADEGDRKILYVEVDGEEIDISELEAKEGGKYQYGDKEIGEKDIKEKNIFNSSELRKFLDRYNLYQKETGASPQVFDYSKFLYIGSFPYVSMKTLPAPLRFYKFLVKVMRSKGLIERAEEPEKVAEDEKQLEDSWDEYLNTLGGDNEYTGATIDLAEAQEAVDEVSEGELVDEFFKGKEEHMSLDPLLAYEYNKGDKFLGLIDKQAKALDTLLAELLSSPELDFEIQGDLKEIKENILNTVYLDNIENAEDGSVNTRFPFALPVFVLESKRFEDVYKRKNIEVSPVGSKGSFFDTSDKIGFDNINYIRDFFNDLGEALLQRNFRFSVGTRKAKKRGRTMIDSLDRKEGQVVGSIAERPEIVQRRAQMYEVFNSVEDTLKDFFMKAQAYYFDTLSTGNTVISFPSYSGSLGGRTVSLMNKELNNERKVAPYDATTDTKGAIRVSRIERVLAEDFQKISEFFETYISKEVNMNARLIRQGRAVAESLSKLGPLSKKDSNDYVSLLLYNMMVEIDDFSLQNKRLDGKTIEERAKSINANESKGYRLELIKFLEDNQGLFTDRVKDGYYDRQLEENYFDLMEIIEREVEKDTPFKVLKSQILKAHDAIRKQLGKKTIYSFRDLDYDNVDEVITKMYKEENIDLSHMEVENIVKAVDSFDSIGREHAISSDHVYLLKAQFRNRVW